MHRGRIIAPDLDMVCIALIHISAIDRRTLHSLRRIDKAFEPHYYYERKAVQAVMIAAIWAVKKSERTRTQARGKCWGGGGGNIRQRSCWGQRSAC